MKKLLALSLSVLLALSLLPSAAAADSETAEAAGQLYSLGLFNGTGTNADGTPDFDLDRAPTRQEAVTMLVRLLGKESQAEQGAWSTPFSDVADWAAPYVGYAYANGLTAGTSASTYSGDDPVTASQYLTFVLRALGYTSGADFQWDRAWELTDRLGITDGRYTDDVPFTRGGAALVSFHALQAVCKGTEETLIQKMCSQGAVDGAAATAQGLDVYGWTDQLHFIYDIRTFTLYAFMNYTGYDDNNGQPITGVRRAVREELAAMDLQLSAPDYYLRKGVESYFYTRALKSLGGAPEFNLLEPVGALSDLPQYLREFYLAADIPALYEKYRPEYEAQLNQYRSAAGGIVKMVGYLDAGELVSSEFGIEVNLLDAWNRGDGLGSPDLYYGYGVIRTGPSDTANTLNILHEYAHGFVNPLLDRIGGEVSAVQRYYVNQAELSVQGYSSWESVVDECFVRAFSTYFDTLPTARKSGLLQQEVNEGFVMTRYIYDRIPEFETFEGDLEDFMRMLLIEYPQYAQ